MLQEIEREDQAWEDSQRWRKPTRQSTSPSSESEAPESNRQPTKMVEAKPGPEKPRGNAPRGFY